MRSAEALALSLVISAAVAQQQYRPGSGFAGGSSGFGGSDGNGGFNDVGAGAGSGDSGSLEETIPGVPGDDYPIFAEVPETSFLCDGQSEGGYYADPEAECQVFHICGNDGNGGLTKYSFLCPNGTIFQQQYFVCDWWFNVDCSLAESLYSINDQNAAEREAISAGSFGERRSSQEEGEEEEEEEAQDQPQYEKRRSPAKSSRRPGSSRGNIRSSRGLNGGYEAIGSPGFGGQGSFGPDGVFSVDADYQSEGLASYKRPPRDILEDYINLNQE